MCIIYQNNNCCNCYEVASPLRSYVSEKNLRTLPQPHTLIYDKITSIIISNYTLMTVLNRLNSVSYDRDMKYVTERII